MSLHRYQSSLEKVLDSSKPFSLPPQQSQSATTLLNILIQHYNPEQTAQKGYKPAALIQATYQHVVAKDYYGRLILLRQFHFLEFESKEQITGALLIALFALYIISIGYAIYRGISEPPQLSDSESDDESTNGCDEQTLGQSAWPSGSEASPLLGDTNTPQEMMSASVDKDKKHPRPLYHHVLQLIFGLLALSLSGYILARSAGTIADSLHLSGTVFGLTVIAFATTLPEKLIAMLSGFRGQGGIIVATTAGSNIFLLTLCVGIVAVAGSPLDRSDTFVLFDLVTVWVSSLGLLAVVFLGPHRIAGLVLLAAYVIFLVMEFTVYRR